MGNSVGQLTESTLSASSTSSTIANKLPDEILLEILFRVPLEDLPSVPFICRKFSKLVRDPNFLRLRLLPTLHVCNFFDSSNSFYTASVPLNALHWSPTIGHQFPSFGKDAEVSFVSLGRSIYIISRKAVFQYDTWTKTTAPIAPTLFPCDECSPAAINGKIYVYSDSPWNSIQEYDPVAEKWSVVASYANDEYIRLHGVGAGGVFYLLHPVCSGSMMGYDVSLGQWVEEMPARLPYGAGLLAGACGTPTGHVYIITYGEMKLRFWRWEGIGQEWIELEAPTGIVEEWLALKVPVSPPLTDQLGLLWESVRVSCVAVRDERVVAIVNVWARRGGDRPPLSSYGWYILMYNVADGSWTRGLDLPTELRFDPSLAFTEY